MPATILDGKKLAQQIRAEIAEEVAEFIQNNSAVPCLAAILIGDDPAMQRIYQIIATVSQNKSTVLITGASGTGKELVARTLHAKSPWSRAPFVAVNCGAFTESLLDSQLFGHRRGAFTGAINDQEGVFQAATGGTLFLDEVSEIPLSL